MFVKGILHKWLRVHNIVEPHVVRFIVGEEQIGLLIPDHGRIKKSFAQRAMSTRQFAK